MFAWVASMTKQNHFSKASPQIANAFQAGDVIRHRGPTFSSSHADYVILGASPMWGAKGGMYIVMGWQSFLKGSDRAWEEILDTSRYEIIGKAYDHDYVESK